jgi:hypothetical protein
MDCTEQHIRPDRMTGTAHKKGKVKPDIDTADSNHSFDWSIQHSYLLLRPVALSRLDTAQICFYPLPY